MNLLIIVAISIVILFAYCYPCIFSTEFFSNGSIDRTGKIDYLLSDTQYHNISDNVRDSIDDIPNIPTDQDMKDARDSHTPVTTTNEDIVIPRNYNPISDKNKNCKKISACSFYASSDYQNCTSCVDHHNGAIKGGNFNPSATLANNVPNLKTTSDCPCKVNNFAECKNVQKIIQCEKITNPYSTVDAEDCGFVFFAQGAKHDYDTGVALSHSKDINYIKAPDSCSSLNKQAEYENGIVMPNPRFMDVEGNNLSEKIKNWIAQHKELIYDEYTDHCSPALNNNGNKITRDCASLKFMTAGTQRGKDYPGVIGYDNLLKRIKVQSIDEYDSYLRKLKEGLNEGGESLIRSQEALLGIIACKNADNIALNEDNADFMWKCYKEAYPDKLCNNNPSHEIYPTDMKKTLKLYSGVLFKDYKQEMDNMVKTTLQGYSNPDSTATQAVKTAYEKCTGKTYNLDYLDIGKLGAYQPGFDVMVFKVLGKNKQNHGIEHHTFNEYDITNHVVLPSLNIDGEHIREILGTAMDADHMIRPSQKTDIRCHIQGVFHFSKPGNYYFRILSDDGVAFRVDNGKDIINVIPETAFRSQGSTPYYGVIKNVNRNKVMPFNIIWGQGHSEASLKVSYHYAGKNTYSRTTLQSHEKNTNNFWKLINDEQTNTQQRLYPALRALRAPYFNNVYKFDICVGSYQGTMNIGNIQLYDKHNNKIQPTINKSSIAKTYYETDQKRSRFPKNQCENQSYRGGLFNGIGQSNNHYGGLCKNKTNGSMLNTPSSTTFQSVSSNATTTIENLPTQLFNSNHIYQINGLHNLEFKLSKPINISKVVLSTKKSSSEEEIHLNRKNYIRLTSAYNPTYTHNDNTNNLRFFLPLIYPNKSSTNDITYQFKMYAINNNHYHSFMM